MEVLALGAVGLGRHGNGKCQVDVDRAPTALVAMSKYKFVFFLLYIIDSLLHLLDPSLLFLIFHGAVT